MTDEVVKNLLAIVIALFTALNTSILWSIRDLVKKHEQTLYGANGDNGHQQELKTLRDRTHQQLSKVTEHEMRISLLEGDEHPKAGMP